MPQKFPFVRLISLLLCIFMSLPLMAAGLADQDSVRAAIEEKGDNTRLITVPGRGETLFYAQANPLYDKMRYEQKKSGSYRSFGEGGCGPTAAASALMVLLDAQELTVLQQYSMDGKPYSLCVHAINKWSCSRCEERMEIVAPADYRKYLPVILGAYACGNNAEKEVWRRAARSQGGTGGTGMQFLYSVCPKLGLTCVSPKDNTDPAWLDEIDEDTVAVVMCASSPFTGSGHYVSIVAVDETYFYLLDPMQPASYSKKTDSNRILEVMEPGLVRVKRENYRRMGFYTIYLISDEQAQ